MNDKLISVLQEISSCYEYTGDKWRARSYNTALQAIEGCGREINCVTDTVGLKGIGNSIGNVIGEILRTGDCAKLTELRKDCPPKGVDELQKIPGVGPKTAAKVWKDYGVTSLADLKAKIDAGIITDSKLVEGIDFAMTASERQPIGYVLPVMQPLLDQIRKCEGVLEAEFAGSLRRQCDTIGDVDIIIKVETITVAVQDAVRLCFRGDKVDADGERKIRVRVKNLQVDCLFVPKEEYGAALQYFTGSKMHNITLRTLAKGKGLLLNEKGLFKEDGTKVAGDTEQSIYDALNVPMLPPELRQDGSEIGKTAPRLLELGDIKGLLHNHSTWSDGRLSVGDLVGLAKQRGYKYIAITDHSPSLAIAGGLKEDVLEEQMKEIKAITGDIKVLSSSEMDVKSDGMPDYPIEVIKKFDLIVLALHRQPRVEVSKRFITAIEYLRKEGITVPIILAHPSGRQFGKGDVAETDWDALFDCCAKNKVILEINALRERMDLEYSLCKKALAKGCKFCISTDTHGLADLDELPLGISVARRAWLTPDVVVNTFEWEDVLK